MPTAVNNLLVVEQQLWTIALAWPAIASTVRPGNVIRFDGTNGWPDFVKARRAPRDGPELELEIGSGSPDSKAPRTLCIQPNVNTVSFDWTVTAADKKYQEITQVIAELKAAMNAAGVQLGLPAVVARWEESLRPGRSVPQNNRAMVWTQRITIKG